MATSELRFMAGQRNGWTGTSPLNDAIMRALTEVGRWDIEAMRRPGCRMLEAAESDGAMFRTLAPLPEKAQVQIDKAVVEVGMERLTVVADLLAAGLTFTLADPLSVAQLEWYSSSKVGAAQRTMSPSARGETGLPILTPNRLPVYLTTDKFEIDIRTLRMSQRAGMPLDTSMIKQKTRAVNEAIEDAAINGATTLDGQDLQVAGYKAPGILNAPNAETVSLAAADWDTVPNGPNILADVLAMKAKLVANKKFGPYRLYVNSTGNNALDADYSTTAPTLGTIRERLLKIDGIEAVRVADLITTGNNATPTVGAKVALVQMTSDVIDVVVGQAPTVIPWTSLDGFWFHNLVMAIMIPRVRSDSSSQSGICIGTTA